MASNNTSATTPKDVFYHLLAIVTLYMSAVSFIVLVFQLVNAWLPDQLSYSYGLNESIRWSASILFVSFPVYIFLMWLIHKDIVKEPGHSELKIRKWLGYLTLFISAIVAIVDVATLFNSFFGGELTARFVLKVLVVLAVSAAIFFYYLRALHGKTEHSKEFAWIMSVVVLAAIIGGFVAAGSPATQRKRGFDERRVMNLQELQSQIISHYQLKGILPASLDNLKDSISGFVPPADPETNAAYEYHIKGALNFDLCATFNLASEDDSRGKSVPQPYYDPYGTNFNWSHTAGRVCFDRTIDPQLYPVTPKTAPVR
ncbi:MAG: hypothetical protein A3I07_00760 [Candidatus Doudnabacteria bacterium RIFCSPLOWO2_02_FULL_42_9]|uniref:DUF5671 domain-containing protein n=1 Tax=Candidatus Doudnabacteria bacterium RIFCSPHIGHO2_01_FULL_41_86 TaxID=1817821 RepID=A0A1F5NA27_9BACT|nr:MAG: hypothetical protein A2717_02770 [Candidatus Doudnabacteria bacterium RIFCSPHIGHO2_01_FULL_41_86]OGE75515.1 MAG: hypothetical protein A3K07_01100 [Candidatus Doudnabacteria bacterium RIFCSPHIGHO2_01_43_10]OGE85472.1 MAG: hypothetical protein A3E28_02340 [Candidatus Doudnabacteria bacterium RIFCSPHIGHO2_12_FULL_42_22]OGE87010.1 MAG: hypothetical protein A3C49_03175 [Candidatus Doudnabacteria bacterium RIFCSPHIGHO2_02_FULL_42_25]OGE92609.1 MAG: hypothetical protein A2895_03330 [Candidatus